MRGIISKLLGFSVMIMLIVSINACEEFSQDVSEVTIKIPIDRMVFAPSDENQGKAFKGEGWYQKEISYDVDSLLSANGSDYLHEAIVTKLNLGVLFPSNQNLTFLRSAKVSVSYDADFSAEVIVAEAEKVIAARNEISFMVSGADLRSYLYAESFFIRVYFNINQYSEMSETTTMYVDGVLKVRMD